MNGDVEHGQKTSPDSRRMSEGKSALMLRSLMDARDSVPPQEQDPESKTKSQIADMRVELFLREHDATGAWKGERLGRDLARDLRDRPFERNEAGEIVFSPDDERNHIVLVHMGELDRLNASGDHSLGDHGLRLTAEHVESVVREVLGRDPSHKDERRLAEAYDIYRRAGNDFALNLRDVDVASAEEIRRRLAQDAVDISSIKEGEEPIPIAASRITRADGIALMNRLDERPEDVGLTDQRVLIDAMFEKVQTLNDIAKIEMRTGRMLDTLREARQNPNQNGEEAARELYDKFLRKSLGDVFKNPDATEPATYDMFRNLITDRRALEVPPSTEWTHLVTERAMEDAFRSLSSRRAVGRSIELSLASAVARDVLQRNEKIGTEIEEDQLPPSTPDFRPPEDTRGRQLLKKLEVSAREFSGDPQSIEAERARVEADLERSKRDERTGLLGRGVYYETMNKAMAEGRPVATIALDMAFLKYFDKEGGPGTGDLAIKKAAEVLDRVAVDFLVQGIEIEAYRTGGDEFALTIIGGDEKTVTEVLKALRQGERTAGRIPATAGASPRYHSEGLQFNYGVRQAESPAAFRAELEALGIPLMEADNPHANEEMTDYLVRLADKEVEIQKGVNRMMMLLKRTLDGDDTQMLRTYSQKALFGGAGEAKLQEMAGIVALDPNRIVAMGNARGEITRFVIDRIDAKNKDVARFETSLDKRLEDAVRIRFFEARISELEEEVESLSAALKVETSNRESLGHAVKAAEAEKRAIVELRARMNEPKVPKPEPGRTQTAA